MLRFISFGSGSSGNCYYLSTETDRLLIDAGIGIRTLKKRLHDINVPIESINRVLVTHDHADHIKSVGVLGADYGIDIYATNDVHNGIHRNYCVHPKVPGEHAKVLRNGDTVVLGDFTVTTFSVPHDSSDNVGYRIEVDGVVFCLMTDIGHITDDIKQNIAEANYLVIEADYEYEMLRDGNYPQYLKERIVGPKGHLSNKECAEAIANNATPELRHVWLCHLSEENNHPDLAQKTVDGVLRSYGLISGKDFKVEVLKRKSASAIYELV